MFKKIAVYILLTGIALGAAIASSIDGKSLTINSAGDNGAGDCCASITTDFD